MATEKEVLSIFDELQTAYVNFKPQNATKMLDVYVKYLTKYSYSALQFAVGEYIKTGKYFPSVSEIVQLAEKHRDPKPVLTYTYSLDKKFIYLKTQFLCGEIDPVEWNRLADEYRDIGFTETEHAVRTRLENIQKGQQ